MYYMYLFLIRKIKDAKARVGCASSPPDVLMKVLSGSITVSLSPPIVPCPKETKTLFLKTELLLNTVSLCPVSLFFF